MRFYPTGAVAEQRSIKVFRAEDKPGTKKRGLEERTWRVMGAFGKDEMPKQASWFPSIFHLDLDAAQALIEAERNFRGGQA